MYDVDADGIEDDIIYNGEQLEKYYIPNVFHPTENIFNTRHGGMPGQR